jgi:hypothetical protein
MDQSQIDLVAIYIDAHYVLTQRSKPMRIAAFATWNVKDPSPIQKMGPRPQIWRWMERVAHLPFGLDFFPSLSCSSTVNSAHGRRAFASRPQCACRYATRRNSNGCPSG